VDVSDHGHLSRGVADTVESVHDYDREVSGLLTILEPSIFFAATLVRHESWACVPAPEPEDNTANMYVP
jgi:hypothetical protein